MPLCCAVLATLNTMTRHVQVPAESVDLTAEFTKISCLHPAVAALRPRAMPGSARIFYPAELLTALLFRNAHLALRLLRFFGVR